MSWFCNESTHNINLTQLRLSEINRMESVAVSRPKLVWVISIVVGLMAASQMVILSSLFVLGPSSPGLRNMIASVSAFDWLTLYVLAGILLTSMVFLFRLRQPCSLLVRRVYRTVQLGGLGVRHFARESAVLRRASFARRLARSAGYLRVHASTPEAPRTDVVTSRAGEAWT